MPDSVTTTSIRGRPEAIERDQFARRRGGHSCRSAARRPSAHSAWAIGPPSVLRLSVPHSTMATVSGSAVASAGVAREQPLGLVRAVLHREGAGDAERIEAMQVAAGRQDGGGAQQVAARRGAEIAAVERVQDRRQARGRRPAARRAGRARCGSVIAGSVQHLRAARRHPAARRRHAGRAGSACIPARARAAPSALDPGRDVAVQAGSAVASRPPRPAPGSGPRATCAARRRHPAPAPRQRSSDAFRSTRPR